VLLRCANETDSDVERKLLESVESAFNRKTGILTNEFRSDYDFQSTSERYVCTIFHFHFILESPVSSSIVMEKLFVPKSLILYLDSIRTSNIIGLLWRGFGIFRCIFNNVHDDDMQLKLYSRYTRIFVVLVRRQI
jgi:hypothetical protein